MEKAILRKSLILLCFVVFSFQLARAQENEKSERKLKIGVVAPLSGGAHVYGEAIKNGIVLALEQLQNPQLEVVFEDDQFLPALSVTAFRKLVSQDRVDLVFSVASTPSNAVAPLAEQAGVPLIAWASDQKVSRNRKYVIRSYMSGFAEGQTIASEAKRRNLKPVATVITANDYPQSVVEGFLANFPKEDVLLSEEFLPDTEDYRSFASKARAKKIAAFFVCLNPGNSATFAKQVRAAGMQASFFGCENLNDLEVIRSSGGALLGAWLAGASAQESFRQEYIRRFGGDSIISGAAIHYDLIKYLNEVVPRWRQGEKIVELIMGAGQREGKIGRYHPRNVEGDQYIEMKLVVKVAEQNGFKELG